MEKLILCKKYKRELPSLDKPPYPGPKGQEIYETVSKMAWEEWINLQTMLINEGQLNLTDKDARKYLKSQMELFLSNKDYAKPKGYKPI